MKPFKLTLHSGKECVIIPDKVNYAMRYENDEEEKGTVGEWTRVFFDNGHAIDIDEDVDSFEKKMYDSLI